MHQLDNLNDLPGPLQPGRRMDPGGDEPAACRPSAAADALHFEYSAALASTEGIEAFLSSHAPDSSAHQAASGTKHCGGPCEGW